jgi:hypothetical protein
LTDSSWSSDPLGRPMSARGAAGTFSR